MKQYLSIIAIFILTITFSCHRNTDIPETNFPFPVHTSYMGNYILPNNYTQAELDQKTRDFYDKWQNKYIKHCSKNDNQYYVDYDEGQTICVSEGLGYGMMITVFMAGYDENAKTYFDGMYRFLKAHPSSINNNLMSWEIIDGCIINPDGGNDAASDGDIDVAFALLLADKQWGSEGEINYYEDAKKIIAAIMKDEINQETWTVKLGDWSTSSDSHFYYSTRPSDFIMSHFRAFETSSGNENWKKVTDTCYSLINQMQTKFSSQTGLIPDFIVDVNTSAKPAEANFLESQYDGNYYYNACRVPWRITNDYLVSNDIRAKNAIDKINTWILNSTGGDVNKIYGGYNLNGDVIGNYNEITFEGAFAVAAMLSENQQWLNSTYKYLINEDISRNDYFGNTLKMLELISLSGNYWSTNFTFAKPN